MGESALVLGLVLLAAALVLLVIDLFVPSAGILSLTAALVAVAGVVCLFTHDTTWGLIGMVTVIVMGPALFLLGLKVMPHTPIGRQLILRSPGVGDEDDDEDGPIGLPSPNALAALVGQEGEVLTELRPIGTVRIGESRYDALSETTWLPAGTRVRVVHAEAMQIRVRPVA